MGLLILYFVLSILFSFMCSIWEAVLLSITPRHIKKLKAQGKPLGETLEGFKDNIDRPLSAILTLNTIAHTVGAIGVGAKAGDVFGNSPIDLGFMSINGEAFIAGAMTLAILLLSEIIPKTIGANKWKQLDGFTASSIKVLLFILYPFVWLSEFITKNMKSHHEMSVLSRSEIVAMVEEGQVSGALEKSESKIMSNLIKLEKLTVRNIMTPRTVMIMADQELTLKEFHDKNKPLRFSRIPIYEGQPDNLTGMILKDELLLNLTEGKNDKKLKDIKKNIPVVADDKPLDDLMQEIAKQGSHLLGVMDENGVLVGAVTMEDLFETILGMEIVDETDSVEDMQVLARQKWKERSKTLGV